MRRLALVVVLAFVAVACRVGDDSTAESVGTPGGDDVEVGADEDAGGSTTPTTFPAAPTIPTGALDAAVSDDLDAIFAAAPTDLDTDALERVAQSGDARIGWLVSDLLRFFQNADDMGALVDAFDDLTGVRVTDPFAWGTVTDHMIAWDLPAPPDYVDRKADLFLEIEPGWQPFFADADSAIDWRLVSWGGVLIDDRELDAVAFPCNDGCIPALDDPEVTDAAGGDWYDDDGIVFGLEVDGETRAFPKNIMEVHEMVNGTLGGRRFAMPYCTLCLSAQAYFTDDVAPDVDIPADTYEFRTSGLLSRSNKVMYEFHTKSVFDTFTGVALSGPLEDAGVELEQISIVTTTWGEWKDAHPDTTIIAEDGGIGRFYDDDPLGGRDDDGPIFPIGNSDPRLGIQDRVLGVETPDGAGIAFPVIALTSATDAVTEGDIRVVRDAGGFRAETIDGEALVSHEAFWFAWSQFFPDTELWEP